MERQQREVVGHMETAEFVAFYRGASTTAPPTTSPGTTPGSTDLTTPTSTSGTTPPPTSAVAVVDPGFVQAMSTDLTSVDGSTVHYVTSDLGPQEFTWVANPDGTLQFTTLPSTGKYFTAFVASHPWVAQP